MACGEEGQGFPICLNTSKQNSSFECEEIDSMEVNPSRVCESCLVPEGKVARCW